MGEREYARRRKAPIYQCTLLSVCFQKGSADWQLPEADRGLFSRGAARHPGTVTYVTTLPSLLPTSLTVLVGFPSCFRRLTATLDEVGRGAGEAGDLRDRCLGGWRRPCGLRCRRGGHCGGCRRSRSVGGVAGTTGRGRQLFRWVWAPSGIRLA